MKTHLLVVPNKKTEEINWVKPLNNYLLSIYGNTSTYQDDLNSFNKLRQDIRGVNADATGLRLYYKYYSQLELLDLRIPFANVNKHKKLEFEWFDSFNSTVANKQAALPFEKANVLFNLAALLTKFAKYKYDESIQVNEGVDDATKSTIQLLQSAAGVYQFINENFLHAPSDDLSQSTIKFLCKLMLAQSQEVFTLKVITNDLEQKKNSLIAKLCKSTSTFYEDCYNMINHSKKQSWDYYDVDIDDEEPDSYDYDDPHKHDIEEDSDVYVTANLDASWVSTIYVKYLYYNSLAYYFNGLNLETNRKYGDAIAYFTKSKDIIKQIHSTTLRAISKGTGDVYEILDNYKYQKDAVEIKLNQLNKDNDLIYHDIVPSLVTLPDIKPMESTKVIPINQHSMLQEVNEQNYNNFLNNVVPINIHELSSFYSEEKSQFLRNEMDLVDVSNEEVSSVLEYLKLPKSLIEIKEMVNSSENIEIPPNITNKVSEIATNYKQDYQNKTSIESLRKQILETISASESKLVGSFSNKDELIQLKKVLYDATNSDQKLFSLIDHSFHAILAKGPNSQEFSRLFKPQEESKSTVAPEVSLLDIDDNKQDSNAIAFNIKRLEDILHDINMAKTQKMKLMDKLKTEIHNDDISDILILNSKLKTSNEIRTVIFPEELKKFNPYNEELDKLITKEKSFINDLKSNWNNLVTNPQVKNMTKSKISLDKIVSESTAKIMEFYDNWSKYHTGLIKGYKFYQDLLNHATNVKNNIEMGMNMNEGFKNLNLGTQQFTGGSQEGYRQRPAQSYQQYTSPQSTGSEYNQPSQFPPQPPMVNRPDSYQREQYQYQYQQQPQPQPQPQQSYQRETQSFQVPPPMVNRGSLGATGFGDQQSPQQQPPQQHPVLNRPSSFQSVPPMTYAPPMKPQQFDQVTPSQGYSRPPQLPPKQPSFDQSSAPKPQTLQSQMQAQSQPHPQSHPQPQPQGQVPWNQGENNKSNTSLIYDQPSTYNPNMYNFFSSK